MNIKSITKGEYETIITDDGDEYIRFNGSDDVIYQCIGESYEPLFNNSEIKAALKIHRVKSEMGDLFNRIEDKIISYGWKYRSGISEVETCKYEFVYHHPNLPSIKIKRYSGNKYFLIVTVGMIDFGITVDDLNDYMNDYNKENIFYYSIVGYIVDELIRK